MRLNQDELISKLYEMVRDDRSLLVEGTREIMIVFAQRENGKREASDFLHEIRTSDKRGNQAIATYQRIFQSIGKSGIIHNEQVFRQLENSEGIWEIKEHHLVTRMFCFFLRGEQPRMPVFLCLAFGIHKPGKRHLEHEAIHRAKAIRAEFINVINRRSF